ncbi:N-acetylmuramoyl-L-alanine amidase [bacterium]|nr:N-acetylmuramoyl-L-alanine amidase [candidate division CSSED10-310 bacterium]
MKSRLSSLERDIALVAPDDPFTVVQAPLGPWQGITFHHSRIPRLPVWRVDYARAFNRFHYKKRKWEFGLGYHLLVTWDPDDHSHHRIQASYRWVHQIPGAHAVNLLGRRVDGRIVEPNHETIGICLVGDFELRPPLSESYQVLAALTSGLRTRFDIPDRWLFRHDFFKDKICPGQQFHIHEILGRM